MNKSIESNQSNTLNHLSKNKALFLDRDGVLIEYIPYLSHPDQVKIPVGAGTALKTWQDAGYLLIAITNQSGVGRGYFSMKDVTAVHEKMCAEYQLFDVNFQDILICPHQPSDNCKCRKPSPQLIIEVCQKYSIEISQSFLIGDAPSDLECAINAGCNPVLVLTGRGISTAKTLGGNQKIIPIFDDLSSTVKLIKN
jgi:D-glycero-D-manno-heptose 1,7-bisphosphate phosphatase